MEIQTLIILAVVGLVGVWAGRKLAEKRLGGKPSSLIERQKNEKQENLERVLELFHNKKRVKNDDIEELLDVSDSTATNYLQELEQKGVIEQHGDRGKYVYYTFKG